MVPKQEGGAMNQTEPIVKGIHDNPVSGSHPSGTVTLTSQWKHQMNTYHIPTKTRERGWLGIKAECGLAKRQQRQQRADDKKKINLVTPCLLFSYRLYCPKKKR